MSVDVNVRMSKFIRTPIKLDVRTYAMYTNWQTLPLYKPILIGIFVLCTFLALSLLFQFF